MVSRVWSWASLLGPKRVHSWSANAGHRYAASLNLGLSSRLIYFSNFQLGLANLQDVVDVSLTLDKALKIVTDVFISAAERDIYTGDRIHLMYITSAGIKEDHVDLRKD